MRITRQVLTPAQECLTPSSLSRAKRQKPPTCTGDSSLSGQKFITQKLNPSTRGPKPCPKNQPLEISSAVKGVLFLPQDTTNGNLAEKGKSRTLFMPQIIVLWPLEVYMTPGTRAKKIQFTLTASLPKPLPKQFTSFMTGCLWLFQNGTGWIGLIQNYQLIRSIRSISSSRTSMANLRTPAIRAVFGLIPPLSSPPPSVSSFLACCVRFNAAMAC